MKRIGVDLGGTKIEIMLTEENALNVLERKRVPTKKDNYEMLVQQIADLIIEFKQKVDEDFVIGMGIPGSISPKNGLVQNANTQCLINHPLKKDLEALVDYEVHIENDANCFVLSEALYGAGKGYESVLGIIIGTGMGGGIIHNGQLLKGVNGNAGEWGHIPLDFEGPTCWCGQKGCAEMYLSGTGIQRCYKELTGKEKLLPQIYHDYENKTDPASEQTIKEFIDYFGKGMAILANIFDPDVFVLGGGVSNLSTLYNEAVTSVNSHLFNQNFPVTIVQNQLGDSSGIYGAAMLAR